MPCELSGERVSNNITIMAAVHQASMEGKRASVIGLFKVPNLYWVPIGYGGTQRISRLAKNSKADYRNTADCYCIQ